MLTIGTWEGYLQIADQPVQGHVCSLFFPVSTLKRHVASPLCGVGSCSGCWKQYSWASLWQRQQWSSHRALASLFITPAEKPSQAVLLCDRNHYLCVSLAVPLSGRVLWATPLPYVSWLYWKMRENRLDWCLRSSVRKIALQFISWGLTSRKIAKPCGTHFQELIQREKSQSVQNAEEIGDATQKSENAEGQWSWNNTLHTMPKVYTRHFSNNKQTAHFSLLPWWKSEMQERLREGLTTPVEIATTFCSNQHNENAWFSSCGGSGNNYCRNI